MALVIPHTNDTGRIIANLSLFSKAVEYSVLAALRRGAQATITQTKRRIAKQSGVQQKLFKNQLQAYYRVRETPEFRAWMGKSRSIGADQSPKHRRAALKSGAFYAPGLGKGLWRRTTAQRLPVERVMALNLDDYQDDMRRIGRTLGVRAYRQRLRRELSRRVSKARNESEARSLERALAALSTRARSNPEDE